MYGEIYSGGEVGRCRNIAAVDETNAAHQLHFAVAGQRPISAPDYASPLRNLLLHLLKKCRQVYERLTGRC
jgi:hypothetical protein